MQQEAPQRICQRGCADRAEGCRESKSVTDFDERFFHFLISAKKATYAGRGPQSDPSRPGSHDLHYSQPPFLYIDTYLGGFHFIGEEAVWVADNPIWGMNYYGRMLVKEIPSGFGDFLKNCLLRIPDDAPYRGPVEFHEGNFDYINKWSGDLRSFEGEEWIHHRGAAIYRLAYHGGEVAG
jgi:hypothetical protein